MNAIRCVLFDLDGTLFDSFEGIISCYKRGLEHFGITVNDDSELNKVMGPSLYVSYHDFFGLEGEQLHEAVRIYREQYSAEGIYKVRMYDGIEDLLIALNQKGFTLGLATTKPQVMAEKILGFSGLRRYFNVVCGANLDGSRSDKVELIEESMKQCGFTDKNEVVIVGDRFYDMAGAVKTGIHSIGVTYGFGSREELLYAGAEWIADSPRDVGRLLLEPGNAEDQVTECRNNS